MIPRKPVFCFITPHFLHEVTGGSELQCFYLARELIRRGWQVHHIREIPEDGQSTPYTIDGIRVHGIPCKRAEMRWTSLGHLFKVMEEIQADVWYCRATISFLCPVFINARRLKCGKVVWACSHENELKNTSKKNPILNVLWKFNQILFRNVLARIDHILLQTQDQKKLMEMNFGHTGKVIYNAHPLPDKEKNEIRRPIILWIGRLQNWKRPDLFVQLAEQFSAAPYRFTAIGKPMLRNGHLTKLLVQAGKRLTNFEFTGELENQEVHNYLSTARLLVSTSDYEGFSNTFIEAWARGVPVVSLTVDPDNLLGKMGLGLVSKTEKQLIKDVEYLMTDMVAWAEYSSRCRNFFQQHLSIENTVDQLETLLLVGKSS